MLTELIVETETGDVERLTDHSTCLHGSEEWACLYNEFVKGLPFVKHML